MVKKQRKTEKSLREPVFVFGSKIASTWWGMSWNKNLERYADYESRLGRGRTYVRKDMVIDLKIMGGSITALVEGSQRKPYKVTIDIDPVDEKQWRSIVRDCAGKIGSVDELLEGRFPKDLSELFFLKGQGLFPTPREIHFKCTCPDWALMCKHVAATLYGVGARLDKNPELFFTMRNINLTELIRKSADEKMSDMLKNAGNRTSRTMGEENLGEIFGIDIS